MDDVYSHLLVTMATCGHEEPHSVVAGLQSDIAPPTTGIGWGLIFTRDTA